MSAGGAGGSGAAGGAEAAGGAGPGAAAGGAEAARRDVAPLRELLRLHGVEASRQALAEECGDDRSIAAMAECLRRRGLRPRLVAVRAGDLPLLGATLVELRDGAVGLLRAAGRGRYAVESGGGTVVVTARDAGARLGDRAVELGPAWPATGAFLGRVARQCLDRPALRAAAALYVAALAGAGALGYVTPAIVGAAVDRAIPEGASRTLTALAVALAVVGSLQAIAGHLGDRAALYLETRLSAAACQGLFAHYLDLPLAALQRCTAGRAYQALEGVPAVVRGVVQNALGGAIDLLLAAGYVFWAAAIAPPVAAGLVVAYGGLLLVTAAWTYPAARRRREALDASAEQSDRLVELIRLIATVRAEAAEGWAVARWTRALRAEQRASLAQDLSTALLAEFAALVRNLVVGATVLWAASACLSGERTLGQFFAVVAAASACAAASSRLVLLVSGAVPLRVQARAIDEVLAQEPGPAAATAAAAGGEARGPRPERGIVVDRAWFRYGDETPWVIEDLSLAIAPGAIHTIRWPSGRGKSTLLRLLAGLYVPARGAVTVQGLDARRARHLVAYVPQGCALLAGSIRSNLRALSGDAPAGRIDEAAEATGLRAAVERWPMGLDTIIAARGGTLSSGQQQLVVLAAALASTRPVLLLDEATTHVDLILRARLGRSALLAGRTVVNVIHFDDVPS